MNAIRIETTSSGYRFSVSGEALTKRYADEDDAVPLRDRCVGESFYVLGLNGCDYVHATRISDFAP